MRVRGEPRTTQDVLSVEQNTAFFAENATYAANVARLKTYRNIRRAVDAAIAGGSRLLDVGNGGVFDYDTDLVDHVVAVDLFLDETEIEGLPRNVTVRRGDALSLDEPSAAYDIVLFVLVLHHLVAADVAGTVANVGRAVAEAERVLAPGGRIVIVESCVPQAAFAVERRLFGALRRLSAWGLIEHPPTLQLPASFIERRLAERFGTVLAQRIPVGPVLMQFGRRWPALLTPARPYLFIAS